MNITLSSNKETLEELYIAGLFEQNYLEVDPRSLETPFELNLESCYNLLDAGMMQIVVARDENTPVGYFIYTIVPSDLFSKKCVASTICLYIKQEYRGGTLFNRLLRYAEETAKKQGATVMHVALTTSSVSLRRLGYRVDNIVYSKMLEV